MHKEKYYMRKYIAAPSLRLPVACWRSSKNAFAKTI